LMALSVMARITLDAWRYIEAASRARTLSPVLYSGLERDMPPRIICS
jgi:hypothetical protein